MEGWVLFPEASSAEATHFWLTKCIIPSGKSPQLQVSLSWFNTLPSILWLSFKATNA